MDRDQVGAGRRELPDLLQHDVAFHHQVHVDRPPGQRPDARHLVGEEQERRREAAIGHVDMVEVGEGLGTPQVGREIAQVGRPQRELAQQTVARQVGEPLAGRGLGLGHERGSGHRLSWRRNWSTARRNSATWRGLSAALGVIVARRALGRISASCWA